MSRVVLDASAMLAVFHGEPGAAHVVAYGHDTCASAVNVAEVATRLAERGTPEPKARLAVAELLGAEIVPFDGDSAFAAAALREPTRASGLSLGDRACLALARRLGLPAVTADRAWADLDIGVDIRLIRE